MGFPCVQPSAGTAAMPAWLSWMRLGMVGAVGRASFVPGWCQQGLHACAHGCSIEWLGCKAVKRVVDATFRGVVCEL